MLINDTKNLSPTLLLHACCAPCSTAVYEQLSNDFDLTVYWYNPNIFPATEHDKRLSELKKLSKVLYFELVIDPESKSGHKEWLSYKQQPSPTSPTLRQGYGSGIARLRRAGRTIEQLSSEPEGGQRCWLCYQFRLEKVARYATDFNFDYFATTLTVSPHKNTPKIIEIGKELERIHTSRCHSERSEESSKAFDPTAEGGLDPSAMPQDDKTNNIKFLAEDFKKNDGFRRSIELSKKYNLYRQNYCGCEYSIR